MRCSPAYVGCGSKRRCLRPSALVFRDIARAKEIPGHLVNLTSHLCSDAAPASAMALE